MSIVQVSTKRELRGAALFVDYLNLLSYLHEDFSDGWEERVAEEIRKEGKSNYMKDNDIEESVVETLERIKQIRGCDYVIYS